MNEAFSVLSVIVLADCEQLTSEILVKKQADASGKSGHSRYLQPSCSQIPAPCTVQTLAKRYDGCNIIFDLWKCWSTLTL